MLDMEAMLRGSGMRRADSCRAGPGSLLAEPLEEPLAVPFAAPLDGPEAARGVDDMLLGAGTCSLACLCPPVWPVEPDPPPLEATLLGAGTWTAA